MSIKVAQINIRGSKNDDFGRLVLDTKHNRPILSHTATHEIIRVYSSEMKFIDNNDIPLDDVKWYMLDGDISWGINSYTGAPYINPVTKSCENETYILLLISKEYDLLDYGIDLEAANIIHTFKYPRPRIKNGPKMGCVIKIEDTDCPRTIAALCLRHNDRRRVTNVSIIIDAKNDNIGIYKNSIKENNKSKQISLRTTFNEIPTAIVVYDSSSKKKIRKLDNILVDINGKSIDEALMLIKHVGWLCYKYNPKALTFHESVPQSVKQELIKRMRIKYAYNVKFNDDLESYKLTTIRSK